MDDVLQAGGVVVFPADTVYGLGCHPDERDAVERIYTLKGRPADKPAAVMFFGWEAVDLEIAPRTRALLERLLPGPLTALLPNPHARYPLACGPDPETIGLRVPDVPMLAHVRSPLLQTSANLAGEPDARRLADVPRTIRDGADAVVDGGELPGTPSTVIDLRRFEAAGAWVVVRQGALERAAIERAVARNS